MEYWGKKFDENLARDRRNIDLLLNSGWRVAVVWECVIKGRNSDMESIVNLLRLWLKSTERFTVVPNFQEKNQISREMDSVRNKDIYQ
jgi:DNA mismatch endonuclease (patch repair protein)